jgi:hypothetical protein
MKAIKILLAVMLAFVAGAIVCAGLGPDPCLTGGAVTAGIFMFNFADLEWADGAKNMGGLKTIGYYAPISEIDNFPELPANPATAADEVTLESSPGFTFLLAKYFRRLYSTMETSEVKDEVQGETDGQSFKHSAEIFFPGTSVAALAFAANVNNTNMVFIFEEASGGNRRVIGSRAFPARCKPSFKTGKKTADQKGMTLEIFSYGYTPAPLYDGLIHLDDEDIS